MAVNLVVSMLDSFMNLHHHIEDWTNNSTAKCYCKLGSHVPLYPNAIKITQTQVEHYFVFLLPPVFFILNESSSGPAISKFSVKRPILFDSATHLPVRVKTKALGY